MAQDFRNALDKIKTATDMDTVLKTKYVTREKSSAGYDIPALIVGTWNEFQSLGNDLGFLAEKGIIIHTDSNLYKALVRDFNR